MRETVEVKDQIKRQLQANSSVEQSFNFTSDRLEDSQFVAKLFPAAISRSIRKESKGIEPKSPYNMTSRSSRLSRSPRPERSIVAEMKRYQEAQGQTLARIGAQLLNKNGTGEKKPFDRHQQPGKSYNKQTLNSYQSFREFCLSPENHEKNHSPKNADKEEQRTLRFPKLGQRAQSIQLGMFGSTLGHGNLLT